MTPSATRFLGLASAALVLAAITACEDDPSGPDTPSAPSGLTAAATSATTVTVTWNQVSDADSYELDRALGSAAFASIQSTLTGTFFNDTGLTASTQYRYQVRAVKGTAKSGNSAEASVNTPAAGPKVATLTGVPLSRTLSADTTYVLSGYVKVSNNSTLTVPAGTKLVGDTLVPGSSLWILRGSKIVANGTAAAPIVFTSQRAPGNRSPGDWGGIIIVGNAPINRTGTPIFTEGPAGAAENYAGGNVAGDDSGTLKYVRIEYAGYDVSGTGQELNSISSYAVGTATEYDYVQSLAGLDDSFEFWGGGADIGHMISFESGDDHFDWSEGYQGRGQFLIALQTDVLTPRPGTGGVSGDPRGFEGDGCDPGTPGCLLANAPLSIPFFANFTLVGPGAGIFSSNDGNGAVIRRGSGGLFVNGIVARWPGVGISVRNAEGNALLATEQLYFRNILLSQNGSNFEPAGTNFGAALSANAAAWNISEATLAATFQGALPGETTAVTAATVNITPVAASVAATGGLASFTGTPLAARSGNYLGGTLSGTAYRGAANPDGTRWWDGWTSFARN